MIRVKICGIQRLADAQVAAEAGADFIGLVFIPGRPRRLDNNDAGALVSQLKASGGPTPQVAGLFADQPVELVNRAIEDCGLDLVQLCGNESVDYCRRVRGRVIKVLHVADSLSENTAVAQLMDRSQAYRSARCLVTLDRLVEGVPGGTGQSFNWSVAAELARRGHLFLLAGGLTPDNVDQAVHAVRPWGVDVSSGVETGGVKVAQKIRAFIRNARQAAPGG
jgi:phosphoribosylanthranilate isomerase